MATKPKPVFFSPVAAAAQVAPNPDPNVGEEHGSRVPATIDPEDVPLSQRPQPDQVGLEHPGKDVQEARQEARLNPGLVDYVGRRLTVTAKSGDTEEMARLLKLKCDAMNFRNTDGSTPLLSACQAGMDK